jgi:hypothetical protein
MSPTNLHAHIFLPNIHISILEEQSCGLVSVKNLISISVGLDHLGTTARSPHSSQAKAKPSLRNKVKAVTTQAAQPGPCGPTRNLAAARDPG